MRTPRTWSTASSTIASPTCRAAVPRTSTFALNNATLPSALALANKGWRRALTDDPYLRAGLNVAFGKVTCRPVAEALGYKYVDPMAVIT